MCYPISKAKFRCTQRGKWTFTQDNPLTIKEKTAPLIKGGLSLMVHDRLIDRGDGALGHYPNQMRTIRASAVQIADHVVGVHTQTR